MTPNAPISFHVDDGGTAATIVTDIKLSKVFSVAPGGRLAYQDGVVTITGPDGRDPVKRPGAAGENDIPLLELAPDGSGFLTFSPDGSLGPVFSFNSTAGNEVSNVLTDGAVPQAVFVRY